ncbi:hypothetical protein BU14_0313s0002 [Porphyra umbilicalis]|uniref:Uncharacterized protein n=1 Tax=Porphyra umbilicalis TaxID=2786 RepID=A0A1X6NZL8_PORUM|nr:hypothetical protein BU14_0313s0002 [Porphyra umbilicalis]|eukprot:OSX74017.1 hypothetical protein BU14_0313s0002 [Porphyra umbilicalis]
MAFVSGIAVRPSVVRAGRLSKTCAVAGAPVVAAIRPSRATVTPAGARSLRMDTYWEGKAPPSTVLGLGKNVPSGLYLLASVLSLALGSYGVYKSNLASPLTPSTVEAQYILASLLAPISWGLHVASWIQKQNNK